MSPVLSPAVRRGIKPQPVRGLARHAIARASGDRLGIDYAWHGHIDPEAMKRAGVTFVCRYLSHTPAKNLTRSEAELLSRHGIDIVVVWETTAGRALAGRGAGQDDARAAQAQATSCGMPADRPIYFAVDFDASDAQKPAIRRYFEGAVSVLGSRARVGDYGGYWVVKDLFDHNVVDEGWGTYAWSGGHRDQRAGLYQYRNGVRVAGIDSDWDRAYAADFGQWRIGGVTIPAGTQPASRFNKPGEHHNDLYLPPVDNVTPLYFANGEPTGAQLDRGALVWGDPAKDGKVQLDFKERHEWNEKTYVFARGGRVLQEEGAVEYGHVRVTAFPHGSLGDPVPAGDGRGEPARRKRLVTLKVVAIPDEMKYKAIASSRYSNYGDAGEKFGRPGAYSYQCWSTPRGEEGYDKGVDPAAVNGGGGIVRALVPDGGHLWLCDVERVHSASVDVDGKRNGTVVWAYVERSGVFGWVVVAHLLGFDKANLVHHIIEG